MKTHTRDHFASRFFSAGHAGVFRPGILALGLAAAVSAQAGSFTADFNAGVPAGVTLVGSASASANGGYTNSGCLKLTTAVNQTGSMILDDLDSGTPAVAFMAQFKALVGGGTGADGFSLSFASDLNLAGFGEDGSGTGLTVSFDTYDNDGASTADYAGIGVSVYGVEVAQFPFTGLRTGTWVDVLVQLHPDGTLDVVYDGTPAFSNLQTFFYPPGGARLGIGARTGSLWDNHFIDDLSFSTWTSAGAFVDFYLPVGRNVRADAPIRIALSDYVTSVDTSKITLNLDGAAVTPTIVRVPPTTTVTYSAPALFTSGSAHNVEFSYADTASPTPVTNTLRYGFTVATYSVLPTNLIATSGLVSAQPGFALRISQIEANLGQTVERAEKQLANLLINPATGLPYENHATVTTANESGVINYSTQGAQGDFPTEPALSIPGLPGQLPDLTSSGDTNAALEVVSYLYLNPGMHTLGVNSSDGFRLTAASTPDVFALQQAVADGVRVAADTTVSFAVAQAGYYPFRICYLVGGLEAVNPTTDNPSLEFFSKDALGNRILVNDTGTIGHVAAYRPAETLPYIRAVSPAPGSTAVPHGAAIEATLVDGSITVQTNTINLWLNGGAVSPAITRSSGTSTVRYQPASLPLNSSNYVQLAFTDSTGNRRTNNWSFTVENILQQLWAIPPNSATNATWAKWVTTGATERGLAYNPKTGHVLLISRSGISGGPASTGGIAILDGNTGAFLGTMDVSQSAADGVGTFRLNLVGVTEDGVIYACNLTTSATVPFQLYRWQNEGAPQQRIWNQNPLGGATRCGDSFRVRGSGAGTQIIASGNSTVNTIPMFTTVDGTNFTGSAIAVNGLGTLPTGGFFRLGLAFGCGDTFYGETTGYPVKYCGFNSPPTTVGTTLASYDIRDGFAAQTIGAVGVDIPNQRMIGNGTSQTTGNLHSMNLFDLNALSTSGQNAPLDYKVFGTATGNFGTGMIDFTPDGTRVYTLDTGNGIIAFSLTPKVAAPTICSQPKTNIVAGLGAVGFLDVMAIGAPQKFQWRFSGTNPNGPATPIANATNRTLDIYSVQAGNLGFYSVVISNATLGLSVTSAVVPLDTLMTVGASPASQIVPVGGAATLTASASGGLAPYSYQWKLNGNNVANGTSSALNVTSAQVANAGGYTVTVTDVLGQSVTSGTSVLTVGTVGTGTGLTGEYFNAPLLNFPPPASLTRVDATVDFDWGAGTPDPAIPTDYFTVRWSGQVQPFYSQTYTFYTRTDDGVRLWVNGQLLVDKWVDQGATEWSGTLALTAGQKYPVVMEYYEKGGSASAQLSWSSANQVKGIIPQTQLYPAAVPVTPPVFAALAGANLQITWGGTYTLQTSTNVVGPYVDVPGAVSPYSYPVANDPQRYFRLLSQ